MKISLTVNGEEREAAVHSSESLLFVLRESLGLLGAKDACLQGECGSCTVLLDGDPVCSCLVMAADAAGSAVVTVEGLGSEDELHPVQEAFVEHGAVQCGFCTPGFLISTAHLLEVNPAPTTDEIREALSGNICRCTGYGAVLRAVESLVGEDRS
ncbi:MAG: (2Fe-2S)-binding protein [Acidimicrobiia bacterium]|nr:(2Fe-2S)-binding protein [Acidimicrobiia bacterium]